MVEFLVTAAASGSGKTSVVVGLLSLLRKKGYDTCAFKCGPDYIDPMFHRAVMGIESHNLDLFLAPETRVKEIYKEYSRGKSAVVCEGAMGYFDGLGGTSDVASAWHVADTLELPVILVLNAKGASLSLAAQILGMLSLRKPHHVVGVILNKCSEMLYKSLKPCLERETGIKLFGYLPHIDGAEFYSRHLGLYTAGEISDLNERIDKISSVMEKSIDLEALVDVCEKASDKKRSRPDEIEGAAGSIKRDLGKSQLIKDGTFAKYKAKIAVARDEAFCFLYEETLDTLRRQGAELVFFSPLKDKGLPRNIGGLYLPGGYPEIFAGELSANTDMLAAIKSAIKAGMPTVAECGGFLYLCENLEDSEGDVYEQVGIFGGTATRQKKLVRFGYSMLSQEKDSLLFRKGEQIPMHEFHYWDAADSGSDLLATKPLSKRSYRCAFSTDTLYAGFPHLYLAGKPKQAARFVDAAADFVKRGEQL